MIRALAIAGMRAQPKATALASYDVPGAHFKERYTLVRTHGIWPITGSEQVP